MPKLYRVELDLHCRFFSAMAAVEQLSAQSRHVPFTVQAQDQHGDVYGGTSGLHWQAHAVAVPQVHARKWDWF